MEYQKSFKMKKKLPCMRLLKMDTVLNKYQKNIFYVWKLKHMVEQGVAPKHAENGKEMGRKVTSFDGDVEAKG